MAHPVLFPDDREKQSVFEVASDLLELAIKGQIESLALVYEQAGGKGRMVFGPGGIDTLYAVARLQAAVTRELEVLHVEAQRGD